MQTRRTFLAASAAARYALGASDRISLGLIGARNQGKGVALRSIEAGAQIRTLCDIDDAIYGAVAPVLGEKQGRKPDHVKDFRRVLDDKSVDGVIIATPDHWHTHMTLLALQAGKDVYIEKPLSQTIHEGQLIRDASRKYDRVVQVGTMRRSGPHFHEAAQYVGSGKLGRLCLVKAWMNQVRESIGNPPDEAQPATADYDMWLGPAPKRAFNRNRFHYNWRFFWEYGNSELGNQGVHMLDVALMGIQALRKTERCLPTRVSSQGGIYWLDDMKQVPDTQTTTYDFGDLLLTWELRSFAKHKPMEGSTAGTAFYGTEATLVVDRGGWTVHNKKGEVEVKRSEQPMTHEKNFLDCMRSRKSPHAHVEIGRLSTMLCHLGNISHHLRRDVVFDPSTETFGSDGQANAMLRKSYRAGWELPNL